VEHVSLARERFGDKIINDKHKGGRLTLLCYIIMKQRTGLDIGRADGVSLSELLRETNIDGSVPSFDCKLDNHQQGGALVSPLMFAVRYSSIESIKLMLYYSKVRLTINVQYGKEQLTALHYAVKLLVVNYKIFAPKPDDIVKKITLLIEAGAANNIKNKSQETPLDLANKIMDKITRDKIITALGTALITK
jgi:hypothetical protein